MFNFFKKKDYKYTEVPEWANMLNIGEFNEFISCIEGYFKNEKIELDIQNSTMKAPESLGKDNTIGFTNLVQSCYQINKKYWNKVIKEHFDNLISGYKFEKELEKIIDDFTAISKYISVRLWPKSHVEISGEDKMVFREDIEDIVTTLVFDLPSTVRSVSRDEMNKWNVPIEQLYEIGINNVIKNCPVNIGKENIEGKPCYFIHAEHFFVATYAFGLNKFSECIGKYGSIVSFPHRHILIAYPINGGDVITAVKILTTVATGMYKEGPGSISLNIYWYNNGTYLKLPYEITDDSIKFIPPESYLNLLEQILKDKNE